MLNKRLIISTIALILLASSVSAGFWDWLFPQKEIVIHCKNTTIQSVKRIFHDDICFYNCSIPWKNGTDCTKVSYDCPWTERIVTNKTGECVPTGEVTVDGTLYSYKDHFCKIEGGNVCCVHNIDGGRYGHCKTETNCFMKNLNTGDEVYYNSLKLEVIEAKTSETNVI